jgi:hypothetical protein
LKGAPVLRLSGRITGDALNVLRTALEESRVAAIDLAEIELVDRDAVIVLAAGESSGIELRRCPAFIREWITRARPRVALRVLTGTQKQSLTDSEGGRDDKGRRCS